MWTKSYHAFPLLGQGRNCKNKVCVRIFASPAFRAACARSLREDLLCKIFLPPSPKQDPVGPFVQDLCMRFFCAELLCRDVCIGILYDHFVRDLCMRIFCANILSPQPDPDDVRGKISSARFCKCACASSVSDDPLCKVIPAWTPNSFSNIGLKWICESRNF